MKRAIALLIYLAFVVVMFVVSQLQSVAQDAGTVPPKLDQAKPQFRGAIILREAIEMDDDTQLVGIIANFTDEGDGFASANLTFRPVGTDYKDRVVSIYPSSMIRGNKRDGYYVAGIIVPNLPQQTTWVLHEVFVQDAAGNYIYIEQPGDEPYMGIFFWSDFSQHEMYFPMILEEN